jgi:hypothetical protein
MIPLTPLAATVEIARLARAGAQRPNSTGW